MGLRCPVTGLVLVLLTGIGNAAASNPWGNDSATTKPSNVKNAPFSADVITEYDRALDNGGRIHRECHGRIFRDSQGRVRTENQLSATQLGSEKYDRITINDPVQQVIISLNPKNKTATLLHFGNVAQSAPTSAAKQSKPKQKTKIRVGGQPGIGSGPADTLGVPNVPSGQASLPSSQPVQTADGNTTKVDTTYSNSANGATIVTLGTKAIEGITVSGTRTTRTINAGTMGNDKPIVSITDVWVSPDLKVTVRSEMDDGQAGHSTMRLLNIVRAEPDPALFQIPPDYTVKESAAIAGPSH